MKSNFPLGPGDLYVPNGGFFSATGFPLTTYIFFAWKVLDEARTGPFYLRLPAVADQVVEALLYNAGILQHYELHAFVVMPNHVHTLVTATVPLPKLTKSLKGITARKANASLGLTGRPFWQEKAMITWYETRGNSKRSGVTLRKTPCERGWSGMPRSIAGQASAGRPGGRMPKLRPTMHRHL